MKTIFQMLAICLACFIIHAQVGCTKKNDAAPVPESIDSIPNPPADTTPPPLKVKKRVLTYYNYDAGAWGSINSTYGSIRYDSVGRVSSFDANAKNGYKVIYNKDTIHYVLSPIDNSYGDLKRNCWIFLFGPDKKCIKVIKKSRRSNNANDVADNNPFFSNINDGIVEQVDSLVYNVYGQLTEIWKQPASGVFPAVVKYSYSDNTQPVPSEITDYEGHDVLTLVAKTRAVLTYGNEEEPAHNTLWFFAFLEYNGIEFSVGPNIPAINSSLRLIYFKNVIKKYITYNLTDPKALTFYSKDFVYEYNKDSSSYTGRYNPDDIIYPRLKYGFTIKEL